MRIKEPVNHSDFQDEAVSRFAEGVQHNLEEANGVLMTLQSDQKITEATVGTTPEGFSTVWFTITGVCEMVE